MKLLQIALVLIIFCEYRSLVSARLPFDPEFGGNFEGDMLLSDAAINTLLHGKKRGRNAIKTELWPDKTVYYLISPDFDKNEKRKIMKAIDAIESVSCVKFKPKTEDITNYVQIETKHRGCFGNIGFEGGAQLINLHKNDCFKRVGTIIHEFLHALNFFHQQNVWDRDQYIQIFEQNIKPANLIDFQTYSKDGSVQFDFPYDYGSIMHYPKRAFSKNRQPTIITNDPKYDNVIGQRIALSKIDIQKINKLYSC